jgi:hypothetical protein
VQEDEGKRRAEETRRQVFRRREEDVEDGVCVSVVCKVCLQIVEF